MHTRFLLPLLALVFASTAGAQPTWRFHLAFEDGTGAKDTIWMVYDTSATLDISPWPNPSVDTLLGEGKSEIDTAEFNVWMYNAVNDSTKTRAYPYTVFPSLDGTYIHAIHWTPPMTITWDTSLFHAPYLPYSQGSFEVAGMSSIAFSQFGQSGEFGVFNMLIDDSVTVDFLWDFLFPFGVYFGPDDQIGIREQNTAPLSLKCWPNPAITTIHLIEADRLEHIRILDFSGRTVLQVPNTVKGQSIDIANLQPGMYIIRASSMQNQTFHGKFQKVD